MGGWTTIAIPVKLSKVVFEIVRTQGLVVATEESYVAVRLAHLYYRKALVI